MIRFICLAALAVSGCGTVASSRFNYVEADLCEVGRNLADYEGRRIKVSGVFFTDWRNYYGLVSAECPRTVLPFLSSAAGEGEQIIWDQRLSNRFQSHLAISVDMIGTVLRSEDGERLGLSERRLLHHETGPTPPGLELWSSSW